MAVHRTKSTPIQVRIANEQIPHLNQVAQDLQIPRAELIRRGIQRELEALGRLTKTA
jgi:hypothetical protein